MKGILTIAILGLIISSCSNSKKTVNTNNENNDTKVSTLNKEKKTIKSQSKVTLDHPDSLFFYMKKTACLGQCPVYNLEIKHSGEASIEAKHHLPFTGNLTSQFNKTELDSVKALIEKCNYFNLESVYDSRITDVPSTITEINLNGDSHRVKNRYKGPLDLAKLQSYVHKLVVSKTWK